MFQFVQYIAATGEVRADMECSNCAAAVCLFLADSAPERGRGAVLRTTNLATGQRVEARLRVVPAGVDQPSACDVRFVLPRAADQPLQGVLGEWTLWHGGRPVVVSPRLDSSIVTAVAAAEPAARPFVLTVGYDVGGWHDEQGYSARLSAACGLRCERVIVRAADVPELMLATAAALEDPIFDPVTVPTLALARNAAQQTKVVLTGDGSDEFWVGYERFAAVPKTTAAYLLRTAVFQPEELGLCALPDSYLQGVHAHELPGLPELDRYLRLEAANRMRNYHLARLDKITMSVGLEARSPFLDRKVTTLAQSLSARAKCPGGRPKGLLTEAFAPVLPRWLVARKKQPFSVPVERWLRADLRDFAHDVLGAKNAYVRSFVEPGRYLRALDGAPDTLSAMKVWCLLHLELWHDQYVVQTNMEQVA